jgi:RNA polymerase sigma factor (sigma-70 family)
VGHVDGATLEAIERVYRRDFARFLHAAAAITGDVEDGRDAVQDGFAGAVRNRRQFRGAGPLEGWLWRAVVNSARQQRRRRGADPVARGEPLTADNGSPAEAAVVRAALVALPERERLVLFLRYYADLDYASIAEALGITSGTVGAALHSARQKLARALPEVTHGA